MAVAKIIYQWNKSMDGLFIKFQPENPWSLDRGMNGITPGKATLKKLYFNNIYDTILTCKHIISVL